MQQEVQKLDVENLEYKSLSAFNKCGKYSEAELKKFTPTELLKIGKEFLINENKYVDNGKLKKLAFIKEIIKHQVYSEKNLKKCSMEELKKLADKEKMNISDLNNKEEIIDYITNYY